MAVSVHCSPPQPIVSCLQTAWRMFPLSHFAFHVQNSANCVAKLGRNSLSVLANHVCVDCLRDWRSINMAESLLTQFLRCSEAAWFDRLNLVPEDSLV